MMHMLPIPQSELEAWSDAAREGSQARQRSEGILKGFDDSTGVVVFGHSHKPCLVTLGDRLFFNPGSAGKRRFSLPRCCGLLELCPDGFAARILLLERYNGVLPDSVSLDFKE